MHLECTVPQDHYIGMILKPLRYQATDALTPETPFSPSNPAIRERCRPDSIAASSLERVRVSDLICIFTFAFLVARSVLFLL